MTSTQTQTINQSRLVVLKSGQIIGHPITRRELKRRITQARAKRRALYQSLRRRGLNYETRGVVVRASATEQDK